MISFHGKTQFRTSIKAFLHQLFSFTVSSEGNLTEKEETNALLGSVTLEESIIHQNHKTLKVAPLFWTSCKGSLPMKKRVEFNCLCKPGNKEEDGPKSIPFDGNPPII